MNSRAPQPPKPATKPGSKPAPTASAPPAAKPAQKAAVAPSGPAKGLAKKPEEAPTSTQKKTYEAKEVANAFARGEVTLGTALGLTAAKQEALKTRAFTLIRDKRGDLAIPLLEGLVALDPFDSWALVALASLKIDKGAAPLAIKLLDRALQVRPGDITAHALRSEARTATGDVEGAKADLAALADADPNNPAVRRARGLAAP